MIKKFKKFIISESFTKFEDMFNNKSYAKHYDKIDKIYDNWYLNSAISLINMANIGEGEKILELGSGTGFATKAILDRIGKNGELIATEYGKGMYDILLNKFKNYDNVNCYHLDARNLDKFINKNNLKNGIDVVFTNFTYFYFYDFENKLYKDIVDCLTNTGKYIFNVTNFLAPFELNGVKYNKFYYKLINGFDDFLKKNGYEGIGNQKDLIGDDFFNIIKDKLIDSGFNSVKIHTYKMPYSPSQSLDFMINNFYIYGSNISWSSTLNNLPIDEKMYLLKKGQEELKNIIDSSNDNPTIINIMAEK